MLSKPRAVWLMLPAAAVDPVLHALVPLLEPGDIVIEGGNSYYHDDIRRAAELKAKRAALRRCRRQRRRLGPGARLLPHDRRRGRDRAAPRPDFPLVGARASTLHRAPRAPRGEPSQAEYGYLHCGPNGAGHFVKMVHNGIEYGMMAAFAEGFNIIKNADIGLRTQQIDAETTPLREPDHYKYQIDVAQVAELWRRGSVVGSWLLDLTAGALRQDPGLANFQAASPIPVRGAGPCSPRSTKAYRRQCISAALYSRFESRGNADYANRMLSAMRFAFGGHVETKA